MSNTKNPTPVIERDSERLQALYTVNDMLKQVEADGLDINIILPRVLKVAVKQLDAYEGSILVVNEELQIEHSWVSTDNPDRTNSDHFLDDVMDHGLAGWVIRNKKSDIINDTRSDKRWLPRPGHPTSLTPWSIICAPLIIRTRAIGTLTIHKPGENQFDEHDLSLLEVISGQAAITIENARLFEESQRQVRVFALLNEASRIINSSLDINEIMQSLRTQMNELLNAETISIALVDKRTKKLIHRVAEGVGSERIVDLQLPPNEKISRWVMEHAESVLVHDITSDPRFQDLSDHQSKQQTRAMICAPMQFKGEVLGTIQATSPQRKAFSKQDINLLVNLANIASSAIANAQQFAHTQAAEARYTSLFQDSVNPIILTNMKRKIVEANRRAVQFFGYDRHELLGMSIKDLYPDNTNLPKPQHILQDEVKRFKSQAITKEEKTIPVEVYAKRTLFSGNDLLQWIHRDISKEVELEEMRGDLSAMLFHDLQSPLGNVISSLELIKYEIPPDSDPAVLSMLDIALRSSNRLQTLVRSLLDINQLEAGHPVSEQENVDIVRLINDVEEIERPNFERREVRLVRKLKSELPEVYAEEDMIRRVLVNLLDNALRHSQESQEIIVEARQLPDEAKVMVSISDQGVGVPKRYRKTIFEKFGRIQGRSSKGIGLGLAFCRLAVEAHGGRIWVDDAPGGGARFSFTLPVAMPQNSAATAAKTA